MGLRAAEIAGYMFGDLNRTGQSIGGADPFIAAIATAVEASRRDNGSEPAGLEWVGAVILLVVALLVIVVLLM